MVDDGSTDDAVEVVTVAGAVVVSHGANSGKRAAWPGPHIDMRSNMGSMLLYCWTVY